MTKDQVTKKELEKQIRYVEKVPCFINAPSDTKYDPYPKHKALDGNCSVKDLCNGRLSNYDCIILDSNGKEAHGNTNLSTIRAQFEKD